MATPAQIQANRQNAQHSPGPRTEEGKAASSQNRFQHGLCGGFRVLAYEDESAYAELLAALREEHAPDTTTEQILVERMAQHHWLAQRAQVLQTYLIADGPCDPANHKEFSLYLRYQTTNERAFSKCLAELRQLRTDKRNREIGFERQTRKTAEENRKQETHEAKVRLSNARAADAELDFEVKQFVEARLPGHTDIPFTTLKRVLAHSIEQFAAELDANPEMAARLKAA